MQTLSKMLETRLGDNRPPEPIPDDTRVELRERLERDYQDMTKRCVDLEVGFTQLPEEITDQDDARRVNDFLGKQVQPFLRTVEIAHKSEKEVYLALGRVTDEFFSTGIAGRIRGALALIQAKMALFQAKLRDAARRQQQEDKRKAEEARQLAEEEAARHRAAAQAVAPLQRSEAREHIAAAKRAEAEVAEHTRVIQAPPDPGHIRGDYGSMSYLRDSWDFEVEDITEVFTGVMEGKIPFRYITIDERAVRADLAAAVKGARRKKGAVLPPLSIPGIRFFEKPKYIVRG